MLNTGSCYYCIRRWLHQTTYTGIFEGACTDLPFPKQLAHPTSLIWPPDVSMGWSLCVSKYLQRHEAPIQIQEGRENYLHIHRKLNPVSIYEAQLISSKYLLDCVTAVAGILMFGDGVMDEITANIINTSGYPRTLSILMSIFIAIIPLTKVPLNARPIVSTVELFAGLDPVSISESPALTGLSGYTRGILKIVIRVAVVIVFVIISIIFPAFDSIMAFMGSTLCFTICVILPLMFYLKIFGKEVSFKERMLCYFLITISSVFATVGTIWAFLPKSLIGA